MSEFCLSTKRKLDNEVPRCFYWEEDIKKFIRLDFENLLLVRDEKISWLEYFKRRNTLVGEGLIK